MVEIVDARNSQELITLALDADAKVARAAFGALVRRYEGRVRALLRTLCKNPAQADDLAQDAFIQAWQQLHTLRDREKFGAWIKRLAYRVFLHAERRRKLERRYLAGLDRSEAAIHAVFDDELIALLTLCSDDEGELMVLVYGFGFTIEELAAERGQSAGTIKSKLSRAKAKIRASVESNCDEISHAKY